MKPIDTYEALEDFGRVRLSRNFFMRDFLHSEIATWHGLRNVPDNPDRAIANGRMLCEQLLEPLQAAFGRIHIRSGYRSPEVNALGNRESLNCASNERNYARHIWDYPDAQGYCGAMACIVVPWLVDHMQRGGTWTSMAWWIHDHLPYGSLYFFSKLGAFNIGWHEQPERRIDSYAQPKGCLTRPGMPNHGGTHAAEYKGFPAFSGSGATAEPMVCGETSRPAVHANPADRLEQPQPQRPASATVHPTSKAVALVPPTPKVPMTESTGGKVRYRAVHSKNLWRKVNHHKTVDSALYGKDGAVGLFARKVRIDFGLHGDPLYALAWQDGATSGYLAKPDSAAPNGMRVVTVPVEELRRLEDAGQASQVQLEKYFR